MEIEPTVKQGVLSFTCQMAAHHHAHMFVSCQTLGITSRKRILEVMGVDIRMILNHLRHFPGASDIQSPSQGQGNHFHTSLLIFLHDRLHGLAENGDVDALCPLSLTQVVDVLLASAPLLIRYDMENLHAAKVTKIKELKELKELKGVKRHHFSLFAIHFSFILCYL